jgi:hypothetical protein
MRHVAVVALLGLLLAPGAPSAGPLVDALIGVVDGRTVAASDVALARALGVLGFAPSTAPITREEVERFADVRLLLDEAGRIGISAEPAEIERAWAAVVARAGSNGAIDSWLDAQGIDQAWARRVVEQDVIRGRFFEARFAAFVFPDEAAVSAALGPGQHDEAAREAGRARLVREAAELAQAEWLQAARRGATIKILLSPGATLAPPFPPP